MVAAVTDLASRIDLPSINPIHCFAILTKDSIVRLSPPSYAQRERETPKAQMFRFSFNAATQQLNASPDTIFITGQGAFACSPVTEFLNGTDRVFVGTGDGQIQSFLFSGNNIGRAATPVTEAGGTSGIIIDVMATNGGIYFARQATGTCDNGLGYCAIRLTQAALQ